MRKAVGVLKELSADEATRMRYENIEKARRGLESRIDAAERSKAIAIAKNLLLLNLPLEQIVEATGLVRNEVESLFEFEK